jgi:hypothetical protein
MRRLVAWRRGGCIEANTGRQTPVESRGSSGYVRMANTA